MGAVIRPLLIVAGAAIVLIAVKSLIDLEELRYLWHASRIDFSAAAVSLTGVLLMGVLDGVIIAVLASVAMLLWRASRPHARISHRQSAARPRLRASPWHLCGPRSSRRRAG